jgi:hypothetical protein
VLAKLRRDVLKHGVAGGLRYGFGGLHQPVEIVSGQSQSQLVQWGHGKRSTKNKNAATGLWFSDCISPFRRMHRPDSAGGGCAIFWGPVRVTRSLEDLLLGQLELHLQPRPLRCGRRSGPKGFASGPPGMAIEDVVPFKRAVRAGMPRPSCG